MAIKEYLVLVEFIERGKQFRQIPVFAPDTVSEEDVCYMAEAQMLKGFTESYKETIELTDTKILKPKT